MYDETVIRCKKLEVFASDTHRKRNNSRSVGIISKSITYNRSPVFCILLLVLVHRRRK